MFTTTQVQAILTGLVGFIVAALTVAPFYLRARGKRVEAQAEADSLRSKASASRELLESDSLRFVLQVAQTSLQNSSRLADVERELEEQKNKEVENQKQLKAVNAELLEARQEITRLQKRIIELEIELQRYKKLEHNQPERSTLNLPSGSLPANLDPLKLP